MRKSVPVTSALVLTLLATAGNPVFSGPSSTRHEKARSASLAFAAGEIVVKLKNRAEQITDRDLRIEEDDRAAAAMSSRVGASAERLFQRDWNERLASI